MKYFKRIFSILALLAPCLSPAQNVGVSISVGQPGFYGRIDLGGAPAPALVFAQPVVALPPPVALAVAPAPLYLHVPPGHERHWRRHCREYNACGVPVYFVRDDWYNRVYVPHYREHHGEERGGRGEHGRHGDHGHGHDEER